VTGNVAACTCDARRHKPAVARKRLNMLVPLRWRHVTFANHACMSLELGTSENAFSERFEY
jgi:hypothetical protein